MNPVHCHPPGRNQTANGPCGSKSYIVGRTPADSKKHSPHSPPLLPLLPPRYDSICAPPCLRSAMVGHGKAEEADEEATAALLTGT
ncbi:hypothetical protein N7536_009052 [Penicillium majusculum]|nr:hypothetical protein N7536_009052 [Penicillium majusculum]